MPGLQSRRGKPWQKYLTIPPSRSRRSVLPSVVEDSYNLEIENGDGFVGDAANKGAFWGMLDDL